MKRSIQFLSITWFLITGLRKGDAADAQKFFRIVGPTATTITKFRADGNIVWTNAQPGGIYTVQVLSSPLGGTNWVNYVRLAVSNNANTNLIFSFKPPAGMAFVPAGLFTMGDSVDGDGDAIPTNISVSAFYMDTNLVSFSQWMAVYAYATNHGYDFTNAGLGRATNHPVQMIDWYDCVKWSNARSQKEGLTPVYYTDTAFTGLYTTGEDGPAVFANWSANGYRLPTEAEWEKAARGGLSGLRFPWGNTISWTNANYYGYPKAKTSSGFAFDHATAIGYDPAFNSGASPFTSAVGSFAANSYGLYDMSGNVSEWCWDWFGIPYGLPTTSDPTGEPTGMFAVRVLRGGDWDDLADFATCAVRGSFDPTNSGSFIGFRCVRKY